MLPPDRIEPLQRQWVMLLGTFGVAPAEAYPVFDALVAAYSEPHRHYHTLEHIAEMLKVAGRLADVSEDLRAVQLAIWFHDAVYDPKASDNEARSAEWAKTSLGSLSVSATILDTVTDLILVTDHKTVVDPTQSNHAILLDADLAILAAGEARYRRYAAAIRQEYAHVPEDAYRTGRATVLQSFLRRDRLFLTDRMFAEGEAAARHNLNVEIEEQRKPPS